MLGKIARYLVPGVAVLVTVSSLWVNWGTSKANKQVDEGNATLQTANELIAQTSPKYKELFSEANLQGFPGNRDQFKAAAQETADLFVKIAEQYRLAASKFEEASGQVANQHHVDYWKMKAQGLRKLADSKEGFGSVVRLLLDESIQDIDALNVKLGPLVDQAVHLNEESDKFSAEAQKIQDQHKDDFK